MPRLTRQFRWIWREKVILIKSNIHCRKLPISRISLVHYRRELFETGRQRRERGENQRVGQTNRVKSIINHGEFVVINDAYAVPTLAASINIVNARDKWTHGSRLVAANHPPRLRLLSPSLRSIATPAIKFRETLHSTKSNIRFKVSDIQLIRTEKHSRWRCQTFHQV